MNPAKSIPLPPTLSTVKKRETPTMDPPSAKKLKAALFQRTWPPADEVLILKTLARYKEGLPSPAQLYQQIGGLFQKEGVNRKLLDGKLRSLKRRHSSDLNKAAPPADKYERRLFHLSNRVWGSDAAQSRPVKKSSDAAQSPPVKKSQEAAPKARALGEMRNLYPCLFHEAQKLLVNPSELERVLPGIDDHEARKLDKKINKIRKQIAKAIAESARIKNMEMPTLCPYPSTKLQQEKLSAEEDDNILSEYFDKAKFRQMLMPCQSEAMINCNESMAKHMRCESAASVVLPVVAENVLQNNVEVPSSWPHRKNMEVTSKYKPPRNSKKQKVPLPKKTLIDGTKRKIAADCQTPHNAIEEMKVTVHVRKDCCHERNAEGKTEVFLLSIRRPYTPLAKAIIESSSKSEIVGDLPLGNEFSKVFVTEVLQREAPLIHEYGNMKKMVHALKHSIAWPRKHIRHAMVADLAVPDQQSCQGL